MKSTKTAYQLMFFLTFVLIFCACHKRTIRNQKTTYSFPQDWLGHWKGDLKIYKDNKIQRSIPMELINEATRESDTFKWGIIYGAGEEGQFRDYYLREVNKETGHYVVDEKNSIFLDGYVIDNLFVSVFTVAGNVLTSSYRIEGDQMIFEILVNPETPINSSGGQIFEGDSIPPVNSYKVINYQRGILKKKTASTK